MMNTFLVLNVLFYAKDGLTQRDVCDRIYQSKQTVNLIIKNLLEEGHVTVTEVPENKRIKVVRMTDTCRGYSERVIHNLDFIS